VSLEYKGYAAGPIEFDDEARLFSGVVSGLRDVIHFSGRTADELAQAFKDSIDDYLAFCEERGAPPQKP
jgi:predicted HicB family RNase H-like nuclease